MDTSFTSDTQPGTGSTSDVGVSSSSASLPTYDDLIAYYEEIEAPGLGAQQKRNRISALTLFLDHLDKTIASEIGAELGDVGFHVAVQAFDAECKDQGLTKGTRDNRRTELKKWAESYRLMRERDAAPKFETYGGALRHYLDLAIEAGRVANASQASNLAGFHRTSIRGAIAGDTKAVTHRHLSRVEELEKVLGTPIGALTRFVRFVSSKNQESRKTSFAEYANDARVNSYCLTLDEMPQRLMGEIRDFIRFKSAPSVIPLNRNESWTTRPKSQFDGTEKLFQVVSLDGKHYSPSASIFFKEVQSFFGVMREIGHEPAAFSLAWVADFGLLQAFIDFMHGRRGFTTKSHTNILSRARSLLFKKENRGEVTHFGFILQHPEFADRLPVPVSRKDWAQWCEGNDKLIARLQDELLKGRRIKQGRNPGDPLHEILQRQHPITALLDIAYGCRQHYETHKAYLQPKAAFALQRDELLFGLLATNPLRIRMLVTMTYLPDNSGNLYQDIHGGWAIRFSASDFKNEKGAAQKPYDVPVEPGLWPVIEHYLEHVRPLAGDKRPIVFAAANTSTPSQTKHRKDGRANVLGIANAIRKRSKQFLPGCPGFGPHGARHIVATDYIKNNPNGFQVAADILHDKIETVLKHYAHLKAADGHKHYQKWFAEVRDEWRTAA